MITCHSLYKKVISLILKFWKVLVLGDSQYVLWANEWIAPLNILRSTSQKCWVEENITNKKLSFPPLLGRSQILLINRLYSEWQVIKNMIDRLKVKRLKKFGPSLSPQQFRLTLCDPNTELLSHLLHEFLSIMLLCKPIISQQGIAWHTGMVGAWNDRIVSRLCNINQNHCISVVVKW